MDVDGLRARARAWHARTRMMAAAARGAQQLALRFRQYNGQVLKALAVRQQGCIGNKAVAAGRTLLE